MQDNKIPWSLILRHLAALPHSVSDVPVQRSQGQGRGDEDAEHVPSHVQLQRPGRVKVRPAVVHPSALP